MYLILPLTTTLLLLTACAGSPDDQADSKDDATMDALAQRVARITGEELPQEVADKPEAGQEPRTAPGGTRTHVVQSTQFNMPLARLELPAHWNYAQDPRTGNWEVKATGLEVHNSAYQSFTYVTGEFAQYYQAAGGRLRAPLSPAVAFQQDIVPNLRKDGFEPLG